MARYAGILGIFLLAPLLGCQSPGKYQVWIEQLEKELRFKEDYIYELEYELEKMEAKLADSRGKGVEIRGPEEIQTPSPSAGRRFSSDSSPRAGDAAAPLELDISLPAAALPPSGAPARLQSYQAPLVSVVHQPGSRREPALEHQPPPRRAPITDFEIASLEFHEAGTYGFDLDGLPGDEGVLVTLIARNAAGEPLPLADPLSLAVWETGGGSDGASRRLGIWNFSAADVEQQWRIAPPELGPAFELRWPGNAPRGRNLRVFARLRAEQGEEFQVEQEVVVRLPGDPARPPRPVQHEDRSASPTAEVAARPRSEHPLRPNPRPPAEPGLLQPTPARPIGETRAASTEPATADDQVHATPGEAAMNPRPNVDDAPVGTGITPRRAAVDDGVVAPVRGEASALSGTPTAAEAPIAARHAEQPASAPTPAQGKSTAEIGPPPAAVFEPAERRTRNGRPVWRPER